MATERVFGRRLEALVTYLHEGHHLSYARLQRVMQFLSGLVISLGALVNMVNRTAERLAPTAEAVRDEIHGMRSWDLAKPAPGIGDNGPPSPTDRPITSSPHPPSDNNAAERALRNSEIHRKLTGGFRSESGAKAHAVVSSVADTARKRAQDVLKVLQGLIGPSAPTRPAQGPAS